MAIDVQKLRKQCVYETTAPLASVLQDMEQIGGILQATATQRRSLVRAGVIVLIAGIMGIIAGAVISSGLVIALAVLLSIGGLFLIIYSAIYGGKLLRNRGRHELLKQRLAAIQQDADAKEPFSVRLTIHSTPEVLSDQPWTQRKSGKQQFRKESWLSLEGPLLDGTVLSEEITELSRKRTYKNANGKFKTKIRSRFLITQRLTYMPRLYGDATRAQRALHEQIRVPPSATVREVRVNEKAITMKGLVQLEKEVAQTAGMLSMGAYRILNLARRGLAAQGGATK